MSNSTIFSNSTPTRTLNSSFTRSTPTQIQSFAEFQTIRAERLNEINDDLRIQKEKKKHELQEQLQMLTLDANTAHAGLAADERDFLQQQQELITELNRIKIDAEVKAEESRMDHMSKLEMIYNKHSAAVRELTEQINNDQLDTQLEQSKRREVNPEIKETKEQLLTFENSLRELKSTRIEDGDPNDENDQQMFANKIHELEQLRRSVIDEYKSNQASHKSKTIEMTLALDEQDTSYQKEIENIKGKMEKKEQQYKEQLERSFKQLSLIQERRSSILAQRRDKVSKLQDEIKEIQDEFHSKMRDATRVAEKLKTALINVNLRKSQQLKVEKDATSEQQALLRENYALQQQLYQMQKQLSSYKEEFSLLRKELSATIGPRRTASLFF